MGLFLREQMYWTNIVHREYVTWVKINIPDVMIVKPKSVD